MGTTDEKKGHKLTVYLVKKEIANFKDVLKSLKKVDEYKVKGSLGIKGAIYLGKTKHNDFEWQRLLQEGTDSTLPVLKNSSNRAVLVVKIEGRIFVLPFGFGKHLINEEVLEREFGLKAALNLIDADKLRSIDKANLDDLTVQVKTQSSRQAKPQEFNLDIVRDLMRGVTGEPSPGFESLGSTVTGTEALYVTPKIDFGDIPTHLRTLLKGYRSRKYKARFDWVDNLKGEKDPIVLAELQDKLILDLRSENTERVQLSPPGFIDWEDYEGFSFTPGGELNLDLDIATFYSEKNEDLDALDWEKLRRYRLYIKYGNLAEKISVPLWRSLNYQVESGNHVYVFAFSQWYRVNKKYSDEIREYVENIPESKLVYAHCNRNLSEGAYNTKLAKTNMNYVLLDKKLIKSDAIRSAVEVCDVFASKEKEFVHVKFKGSSSMLSHLFAQGKISARLLARDIVFRKNLRAKLDALGHSKNIIPLSQDRFDASKYTVTFAVIEDESKTFVQALPFFSLLNLRLTSEEIRLLGFKVRIKRIKYI